MRDARRSTSRGVSARFVEEKSRIIRAAKDGRFFEGTVFG
jgi:hypothetical protein